MMVKLPVTSAEFSKSIEQDLINDWACRLLHRDIQEEIRKRTSNTYQEWSFSVSMAPLKEKEGVRVRERWKNKKRERKRERRTEMESAEGFESAAQIAHKVLNHACTEHTHMHINTFFRSTISYWELKNQSHRYWYRSIICTVKSALQIFLWLDVQPLILRHARVLFLLISIWCVVTPRQHLYKLNLHVAVRVVHFRAVKESRAIRRQPEARNEADVRPGEAEGWWERSRRKSIILS